MKALRQEDWLPHAKRCAVGQHNRVRHGNEPRVNLVVANEGDRYWAYCQSCKTGGVLMKDHVNLAAPVLAHESRTNRPTDIVLLQECEPGLVAAVAEFLARKGMDMLFMPDLWYSPSVKRLMLCEAGKWHGRAFRDDHPAKWMDYSNSPFLGWHRHGGHAVVVEDPFSYLKIQWVLKHMDVPADVYCSLGTNVRDGLMLELLKYDSVHFMYDGDTAGYSGAKRQTQRVQAMGIRGIMGCAPEGKDPKDMAIAEIAEAVTTRMK